MNREIKFRAWDKKSKKMREVESIGFGALSVFDKEGYPVVNLKGYDIIEQKDIIVHREKNEYILMQYTGLKDKNGVEIYEGDVMSFTAFGNRYNLVVEYVSGMFKAICKEHKNINPLYLDEAIKQWCAEVIGNIHEDLLEGKNE